MAQLSGTRISLLSRDLRVNSSTILDQPRTHSCTSGQVPAGSAPPRTQWSSPRVQFLSKSTFRVSVPECRVQGLALGHDGSWVKRTVKMAWEAFSEGLASSKHSESGRECNLGPHTLPWLFLQEVASHSVCYVWIPRNPPGLLLPESQQ